MTLYLLKKLYGSIPGSQYVVALSKALGLCGIDVKPIMNPTPRYTLDL